MMSTDQGAPAPGLTDRPAEVVSRDNAEMVEEGERTAGSPSFRAKVEQEEAQLIAELPDSPEGSKDTDDEGMEDATRPKLANPEEKGIRAERANHAQFDTAMWVQTGGQRRGTEEEEEAASDLLKERLADIPLIDEEVEDVGASPAHRSMKPMVMITRLAVEKVARQAADVADEAKGEGDGVQEELLEKLQKEKEEKMMSRIAAIMTRKDAVFAQEVAQQRAKHLAGEVMTELRWITKAARSITNTADFEAFIIIIILANCFTLALYDPMRPHSSQYNKNIGHTELAFNVIFTIEAILRIAGAESFKAYVKNPWNLFDLFIVLVGYTSLIPGSTESTGGLRALRALRALRPLRTITRFRALKNVVTAFIEAIPLLVSVVGLLFFFLFLFAIGGIQLFQPAVHFECRFNGTTIPVYDDDEFGCRIDRDCPRDLVTSTVCVEHPHFMGDSIIGFDNIFLSLLTIFQCITLEGWTDIMYRVGDWSTQWTNLYFVCLIFCGPFFIINLFLAVLKSKFARSQGAKMSTGKSGGLVLRASIPLTLLRRAGSSISKHLTPKSLAKNLDFAPAADDKPDKPVPFYKMYFNRFRTYCLVVCSHRYFTRFFLGVILGNTVLMASEYHGMTDEVVEIFRKINLVFTVLFTAEFAVKIFGLGLRGYFKDPFNIFDFIIVVTGNVEIIIDAGGDGGMKAFRSLRILRTIRVLRVFRVFRYMKSLRKVGQVLASSMTSFLSITALVLLFLLVFSIMGLHIYGGVIHEDLITTDRNFNGIFNSLMLIFQVLTMENWNEIMLETVRYTSWGSAAFFVIWVIIGKYILLALFLAVTLEAFESKYDVELVKQVVKAGEAKYGKLPPKGEELTETGENLMEGQLPLPLLSIGFAAATPVGSPGANSARSWTGTEWNQSDDGATTARSGASTRWEDNSVSEWDDEFFDDGATDTHRTRTDGDLTSRTAMTGAGPYVPPPMPGLHPDLQRSLVQQHAEPAPLPAATGRIARIQEALAQGQDAPSPSSGRKSVALQRRTSIGRSGGRKSVSGKRVSISGGQRVSISGGQRMSVSRGQFPPGSNPGSPLPRMPRTSVGRYQSPLLGDRPNPGRRKSISAVSTPMGVTSPMLSPTAMMSSPMSLHSTHGINVPMALNGPLGINVPMALDGPLSGLDGVSTKPAEAPTVIAPMSPIQAALAAAAAAAAATEGGQPSVSGLPEHFKVHPQPGGDLNEGLGMNLRVRTDVNGMGMPKRLDDTPLESPAGAVEGMGAAPGGYMQLQRQASTLGHLNSQSGALVLANGTVPEGGDPNALALVGGEMRSPGPKKGLKRRRRLHRFRRKLRSVDRVLDDLREAEQTRAVRFRIKIFRFIRHQYWEAFVFSLILLNCIQLALETPSVKDPSPLHTFIVDVDYLTTAIFAVEAMFKIYAYTTLVYFTSKPDLLDFFIVFTSLLAILLEKVAGLKLDFFKALRALRPLRAVSRSTGMRIVLHSVAKSMVAMFNVSFICIIFFIVYGILGVQFYSCNASVINGTVVRYRHQCVGNFTDGPNGTVMAAKWSNAFLNYDNIGQATITLFVTATLDGYANALQDMLDATEVDEQPRHHANPIGFFFLMSFIMLCSFALLNLYIGVVFFQFSRIRLLATTSSNFLTQGQKEWLELFKMVMHVTPAVCTPIPKSKIRRFCFRIVQSWYFDKFIMACIIMNIGLMGTMHYNQKHQWNKMLEISNYVFSGVFILEMILKMTASGLYLYFRSGWNRFDFFIVMGSIIDIAFTFLDAAIVRIIRLFRVSRMFRLVKSLKGLRSLFQTLIVSLPAFYNVGALVFLLFFIYAYIGVQLFGKVIPGEHMNDHANFRTFPDALLTMFRAATGETWVGIMQDCMVQPPKCNHKLDNCGSPVAIVYFITFVIIVSMMMLNLFTAVIIENFEKQQESEMWNVNGTSLEEFVQLFVQYDVGTGYIPIPALPEFLLRLSPPLGLGKNAQSGDLYRFGCDVMIHCDVPGHPKQAHFRSTLFALVYRVCGKPMPAGLLSKSMNRSLRRAFPNSMGIKTNLATILAVLMIQVSRKPHPVQCLYQLRFGWTRITGGKEVLVVAGTSPGWVPLRQAIAALLHQSMRTDMVIDEPSTARKSHGWMSNLAHTLRRMCSLPWRRNRVVAADDVSAGSGYTPHAALLAHVHGSDDYSPSDKPSTPTFVKPMQKGGLVELSSTGHTHTNGKHGPTRFGRGGDHDADVTLGMRAGTPDVVTEKEMAFVTTKDSFFTAPDGKKLNGSDNGHDKHGSGDHDGHHGIMGSLMDRFGARKREKSTSGGSKYRKPALPAEHTETDLLPLRRVSLGSSQSTDRDGSSEVTSVVAASLPQDRRKAGDSEHMPLEDV
eukprot:jgi/Mesvir1/6839/Mv09018-RA.1